MQRSNSLILTSLSLGLAVSLVLSLPLVAWSRKATTTSAVTSSPAGMSPFLGDGWRPSPLVDTTAPKPTTHGATTTAGKQAPATPAKPDPEIILRPILPFVSDIERSLQIPQQTPALKTPERLNRLQEIVFGSRVYNDAGEVLAKLAALFPAEAAKSRPALAALLPKNPNFSHLPATKMTGYRPATQSQQALQRPTSVQFSDSPDTQRNWFRPNPMPPVFQTQAPQPGLGVPDSNSKTDAPDSYAAPHYDFQHQYNQSGSALQPSLPQPEAQPQWGNSRLSFPQPAYPPSYGTGYGSSASPAPQPFYNEPPVRNVQLNHLPQAPQQPPVTAPSPTLQQLANKFLNAPQTTSEKSSSNSEHEDFDWKAWDRYMDGNGAPVQ